MEVIRYSDQTVINILGEPIVNKDCVKRSLKNLLCYEVDDGIVLLNGLTRAIVFLKNDELDNLHDIKKYAFLFKNYFFVDEDFDEWEAFEKVRKILRKPIDDLYLDHPSGFTILTSTKCNARCAYCYENGVKHRQHMTEETAQKVAKYICEASPLNSTVDIGWFGGEPLINIKVIDLISDYLRNHGKQFVSSITTNGYLFNEELVKKAKYSWHIYKVQITIDGIGEKYDKIKRYIYKNNISPYNKVINNIKLLLNENIDVAIRINLDIKTIKEKNNYYKDLITELHNIFHNSLFIYVYPIFDKENKLSDEDKKLLYDYTIELDDFLFDYNHISSPISSNLNFNHCMADSGESILINEEGKFGVCEHYIDSNFFTNIDNPSEKDFNELNNWKKYFNNKELCEECPILGDCIKPIKCENECMCFDYKKNWEIHKILNHLKNIYNQYKNNNISKFETNDNTSTIK